MAMALDPRIDTYIAGSAEFARAILAEIRRRVHAACPEVEETIKWSRPCFVHRGQILANMSAFKAHVSFGFWQREALRTGREGEAMGQFGRITGLSDLPDEASFAELVRNAQSLIDDGAGKRSRPARPARPEPEVPAALAAALAHDAMATATFNAFPASCRRDYCDWIAEAKRDETRARRVAEAIEWLRDGKRRNWKYENC